MKPYIICTPSGIFLRDNYQNEKDLESSIIKVQEVLFGQNRIYLDLKKKIGSGNRQNIPDGYLLDLTGRNPRLYVVENELESHDPLRHIAIQILQFSLSFEAEPRLIRNILFNAIDSQPEIKVQCQAYIKEYNFRNLDHLVDELVFNSPFAALVIIDNMPDDLENILAKKFNFGVEVLELARYINSETQEEYFLFEPFLQEVDYDRSQNPKRDQHRIDIEQLNTVVVPAQRVGFEETFIGQHRWHAIRIHGTMRPQIKYIAVYQVAPISAITHIAEVDSIQPWKDTDKFVVNFKGEAQEINPIPLVKKGRVKALQNLRYTSYENLLQAQNLDDLW